MMVLPDGVIPAWALGPDGSPVGISFGELLVTRAHFEGEEFFAFAQGLPLNEFAEMIGFDGSAPECVVFLEYPTAKPLTGKKARNRFLRAEAEFRKRVEASFQDYINGVIGGGKLFFFANKDCLSRAHHRIAQEHDDRVWKPLQAKISDYWSRELEKSVAALKGGAA